MISKAIKQYDEAQGFTYGVKIPRNLYNAMKTLAEQSMMTVNTRLNRELSRCFDVCANVNWPSVSIKQPGKGEVRVKLSESVYKQVEQLRAEILLNKGVLISQAGMVELLITTRVRLEREAAKVSHKTKVGHPAQGPENENSPVAASTTVEPTGPSTIGNSKVFNQT